MTKAIAYVLSALLVSTVSVVVADFVFQKEPAKPAVQQQAVQQPAAQSCQCQCQCPCHINNNKKKE